MEKALDVFHSDYSSYPPPLAIGIFLVFRCENLLWFLESKPMEVYGLPETAALSSFAPLVQTQSLAIHQNYHLSIPNLWPWWLLLQVSRSWL